MTNNLLKILRYITSWNPSVNNIYEEFLTPGNCLITIKTIQITIYDIITNVLKSVEEKLEEN